MLVRIVKMQFQESEIENFIQLFEERKEKIRQFKGCRHLKLLQGQNAKNNIFYTYSIWDNEDALNSYRYSDLFNETWKLTKAKFSAKPEAISCDQLHELI